MGLYLLIPSPAIPSLGKALQDSYLSQSLPTHTHTLYRHTHLFSGSQGNLIGKVKHAIFVKESIFNASIVKEDRGRRRSRQSLFKADAVLWSVFFP